MTLKTRLREKLISATGYWIYKNRDLPAGCDLVHDLNKIFPSPPRRIFDVGANIGEVTLKFKNYFNSAALYSFEPVTSTFQVLQQNTKHLDDVQCFKLALGDKAESVEINLFEGAASVLNSLNIDAQNKVPGKKELISVITGDSFCAENNIPEIDLLKIDTEGYEIRVLQGFSKMIRESRIKAIYCEVGFDPVNKRNTFINELVKFGNENNFKFYGLYEVSNNQIKTGYNYGNILFVHNELTIRLS